MNMADDEGEGDEANWNDGNDGAGARTGTSLGRKKSAAVPRAASMSGRLDAIFGTLGTDEGLESTWQVKAKVKTQESGERPH